MTNRYSIESFIADAKAILAAEQPLDAQKRAIGGRLKVLAKRDDLLRYGRPVGHSDASNFNWILYREKPNLMLILVAWLPGYLSPVHEHGHYFPISVGWRGHDRWDVYERVDDRKTVGFADVRKVDEIHVTPGEVAFLEPPPKSIHSHNILASEVTYELFFFCTPSLPPEERLHFDVDAQRCYPTHQTWGVFDEEWPPRQQRTVLTARKLSSGIRSWMGVAICPICRCLDVLAAGA